MKSLNRKLRFCQNKQKYYEKLYNNIDFKKRGISKTRKIFMLNSRIERTKP